MVGGLTSRETAGQMQWSIKFSQNHPENFPRNIRMFGTFSMAQQKLSHRKRVFKCTKGAEFLSRTSYGPSDHKWSSEIQTRSLDFGHGDLMLLDLLIKCASRNAETLRSLLNTTTFL